MESPIKYSRAVITIAFVFSSAITIFFRVFRLDNKSGLIVAIACIGIAIISCAVGWGLYKRNLAQSIFEISTGEQRKLIAASLFLLGWACLAFSYPTISFHSLYELVSAISGLFLLFSGFYLIIFFLVYRLPHEFNNNHKTERFDWLFFTLPPLLVWSFSLLVFWPALMSYDSIYQWRQATTGVISDVHPITHTLLIWLITRVWQSPAAIAIFQIFFLSFTIGCSISTLRKYQVPYWACVGTSIFAALLPVNILYSITLWKDILYSACILLLTSMCLQCARDKGEWFLKWKNLVALSAVLFIIATFRHNGILISLGFIPIMFLIYWKYKKQIALLAITLIGCIFFSQFAYFNILHFDKYTMGEQIFAPIMAKYYTSGLKFSTADQQLLNSISPVWSYSCSNIYVTTTNNFDYEVYRALNKQIKRILFQSIVHHPKPLLAHLYCASSILWSVNVQPAVADIYYPYVIEDIDAITNNTGLLHSESKLPRIKLAAISLIKESNSPQLQRFFWRSGIYFFIYGVAIIVFLFIQSRLRFISVVIPSFLWMISTMFTIINQEFRYVYPMVLLSIVQWGLVLAKRIPEDRD